MYYKNEFEEISGILNPKGYKSGLMTIIDLIDKLNEKDIEDEKLKDMFSELLNYLVEYDEGESAKKKKIRQMYSLIVNYVQKEHKIVQKGTLLGTYIAIFTGTGVALGVALSQSNATFLALGIAFGAGLGVLIGSSLEKKAEKEGRIY